MEIVKVIDKVEVESEQLHQDNIDLKEYFDSLMNQSYPALICIDSDHNLIHKGMGFRIHNFFSLTGNTVAYFQFKTGDKFVHLKQRTLIDGTNTIKCSLLENPVMTDGTIEISSLNSNRNSLNVASMKIYSNPIYTSGGLELDIDYVPGTNQAAGSEKQSNLEFVLKKNTNYIFKLENLSAGNANILSKCFFYEI